MSNREIGRFKAAKQGWREESEIRQDELYFDDGERLVHLKQRSVRLVQEKSPPPKASTGALAVLVGSALLTLGSVCWMFLEKMGPDPQASGGALAEVITALGAALGGAGIIGAVAKLWRRR